MWKAGTIPKPKGHFTNFVRLLLLVASEPSWMNTTISAKLVSESQTAKKSCFHIPTGEHLEEWTNIRNTKIQYRKQLRNFSKVSISLVINNQTTFAKVWVWKTGRWHQRTLQTHGNGGQSILETGHPRIWRVWNWRGSSSHPRSGVQKGTPTNKTSIWNVCIVILAVEVNVSIP